MAVWAYQMFVQSLAAPFDPFYTLKTAPFKKINKWLREKTNSAELKKELKASSSLMPIIFNYSAINPRRNLDVHFDIGKRVFRYTSNQGRRVKAATFAPIDGEVFTVPLLGDADTDASDSMCLFEGRTGGEREFLEKQIKEDSFGWRSLMGFVYYRSIPTGTVGVGGEEELYDMFVSFRGTQSSPPSLKEMASTAGNADWVTDLSYKQVKD